MGVPRYRATLMKNSPECFSKIQKGNSLDCDNLFVDFNPIIHMIAGSVMGYNVTDISLHDENNMTVDRIYEMCWDYLFNLMCDFKASKLVYIAIDGVAPLAKQNQQRQRRFLSAKDAKPDAKFSPSCISVGTLFMGNLVAYLKFKITEYMKNSYDELLCDIILSDDKTPGEGEHKIMSYIRRECSEYDETIVYGVDGDLLFLTLLCKFETISLVNDTNGTYTCVDITRLRNSLGRQLVEKWDVSFLDYKRNVLKDYVLVCSIFGNDFLPKLKMIYDFGDLWEVIVSKYREFGDTGEITLTCGDEIIVVHLVEFLKPFAKMEMDLIEKQALNAGVPEELVDHRLKSFVYEIEGQKTLFFDGYREYYYSREGPMEEMCKNYWETFIWSYFYYVQDGISWTANYTYFEAPFLSDLLAHANQEDFDSIPTGEIPDEFRPLVQLAMIVPSKMKHLLPKECLPLYDPKSKYFVRELSDDGDYEYDLQGKFSNHQGVFRLPFFTDRSRICRLLKELGVWESSRNSRKNPSTWSYGPTEKFVMKYKDQKIQVQDIIYSP